MGVRRFELSTFKERLGRILLAQENIDIVRNKGLLYLIFQYLGVTIYVYT